MMSFMQNNGNNGGSNHASTSGTLHSNTIPYTRMNAQRKHRSGVVLDGPLPPMPPPYVNPDNEKAKETKDHGEGERKLKDNEKGKNEKEKDDEGLSYEEKGENDKCKSKVLGNVQKDSCFFRGTARTLIDVFGEEMSLRTDEERLIISVRSEELKYTTRPHKESVCMIDIFSSPKEKDEDPNAIFTSSEVVKCDFLTTNGDPITPPSTIPTKEDLTNEKVEKHEVKTCNLSREISSICPSIKERLNFWKNKEVLEKNEILKRNNTCDFQTPSSSLEKKEVEGEKNLDVKTIVSFFAPIGNCVRKWATNEFVKDNDEINHEVFKSDNENDLGVHDNEEEEIAFLDGLLENENFFEMNDKKVESLERKTKEDFETKDEPKSK
ncbi:hypothetical protein Tco_0364948 [Tanacetum coccineum]